MRQKVLRREADRGARLGGAASRFEHVLAPALKKWLVAIHQ
jgi:hypothetical protein